MDASSYAFNLSPYKEKFIEYLNELYPHLCVCDAQIHKSSKNILKIFYRTTTCCCFHKVKEAYVYLSRPIDTILPEAENPVNSLTLNQKNKILICTSRQIASIKKQKVAPLNLNNFIVDIQSDQEVVRFRIEPESSNQEAKVITTPLT